MSTGVGEGGNVGPLGRPRRKEPRYDVSRSVEAQRQSWQVPKTAFAKNVSMNGMLLVFDEDPPQQGEILEIFFDKEWNVEPKRARGEVVRLEKARENGKVTTAAGIRLLDQLSGLQNIGAYAPEEVGFRRVQLQWSGRVSPAQTPAGYEMAITVDDLTRAADADKVGEESGEFLEGFITSTNERAPLSELEGESWLLTDEIPLEPEDNENKRPLLTGARAFHRDSTIPAEAMQDAYNERASVAYTNLISQPRGQTIAIDIGTTTAKIAAVDGVDARILHSNDHGISEPFAVPAIVYLPKVGGIVAGAPAKLASLQEPDRVVPDFKRLLGRTTETVDQHLFDRALGCPLVADLRGELFFDAGNRVVSVTEIYTAMLEHLVEIASRELGAPVSQAVLTVPVEVDELGQRQLELAASKAGLDVLALLPEPVAAALTLVPQEQKTRTTAVVDFGGGSFDVCILSMPPEADSGLTVLGAAGDRWLGGADFDRLLADVSGEEFFRVTGHRLETATDELRLLQACEAAKRRLSTLEATEVILPKAANSDGFDKTLNVPFRRNDLALIGRKLVESAVDICHRALSAAELLVDDIDELILTGSSSNNPIVRDAIEALFERRAIRGPHPGHAVVVGAAMHAARLDGISIREPLFQRLTTDATAQQGIGLALAEGLTEHLITGGTPLPASGHRTYSTWRDGQRGCTFGVVVGDSTQTDENTTIGSVVLEGFPPKEAGVIAIDVFFELESTGMLHVTAQERWTGQRSESTFDISEEILYFPS